MSAAMKKKIAVVTGSNKGIGFEIVKQLAKQGVTTVLTARDEKRGAQAVELLKAQQLDVQFHQLDVSDPASVLDMAAWLRKTFGSIDILVNNAGISISDDPPRTLEKKLEDAQSILRTNYYGAKSMTEATVPLMNPGGRIINVSSRLGQFDFDFAPMKNEFQKQKLSDVDNLTEEVIESCLKEFMEAVGRGRLTEEGYPAISPDYSMSKFALNAYTRILAPKLKANQISINSMCPGYTKTDMTKGLGNHTAEEGADTAVWLAVMETDEYPSGKFFAERKEIHY